MYFVSLNYFISSISKRVPAYIRSQSFIYKKNICVFTQSLERLDLSEGNDTSETDVGGMYHLPSRPVGRARRRLHELLEDSFSLFGSRDARIKESSQTTSQPSISVTHTAVFSEIRGKSAHVRYLSFFFFFFLF